MLYCYVLCLAINNQQPRLIEEIKSEMSNKKQQFNTVRIINPVDTYLPTDINSDDG